MSETADTARTVALVQGSAAAPPKRAFPIWWVIIGIAALVLLFAFISMSRTPLFQALSNALGFLGAAALWITENPWLFLGILSGFVLLAPALWGLTKDSLGALRDRIGAKLKGNGREAKALVERLGVDRMRFAAEAAVTDTRTREIQMREIAPAEKARLIEIELTRFNTRVPEGNREQAKEDAKVEFPAERGMSPAAQYSGFLDLPNSSNERAMAAQAIFLASVPPGI